MLPLWIRESRQECIAFQVRNKLKMLGFRSCLCRDCISRNQSPTLSLSNQKNKNTKVIYTMDFLVLNNSSFAKEIYQALHFSFILGFFLLISRISGSCFWLNILCTRWLCNVLTIHPFSFTAVSHLLVLQTHAPATQKTWWLDVETMYYHSGV